MADGYYGHKKLLYPGPSYGICPKCGRSHGYTGKQFKCTKCGQKILLPQGQYGYEKLDTLISNNLFHKYYRNIDAYNEDMRDHCLRIKGENSK